MPRSSFIIALTYSLTHATVDGLTDGWMNKFSPQHIISVSLTHKRASFHEQLGGCRIIYGEENK